MDRNHNKRAVRAAMLLPWLVPLVAAATMCAPPAAATPVQDAAFLAVLDNQGITYKSATAVITAGYAVCQMRDEGVAELAVAERVYVETALDAYNAGFFVGAAEAAYCPWHLQASQTRREVPAQVGKRLI